MARSDPSPASFREIPLLSTLEDPVRRRLYELAGRRTGVTREEAAEGAGIGRSLAAYHLDRLATEGLLEIRRERRTGRTGPGAGRPANVYFRTGREISAAVPPRDYGLLAELLAGAVAADRDGTTGAALREAARRTGHEAARASEFAEDGGSPADRLIGLLRERGYEPVRADDGTIRLTNCPFHNAARDQPDVVCGLNAALLGGITGGLPGLGMTAELDPEEGYCCVVIRPDDSPGDGP